MSPRQTQETLLAYQFSVQRGEEQEVDQRDGQPLFNGDGSPRMVASTRLIFVCPATGHVVIVPLPEAAREELVRQLTGGIVVAGANGGT